MSNWLKKEVHFARKCLFFIFTQHERNSTTGEFKFRCHFGEEECIGNKIHACSIKYVENPHDLHDYFNDIIDYQEGLAEVYHVETFVSGYGWFNL